MLKDDIIICPKNYLHNNAKQNMEKKELPELSKVYDRFTLNPSCEQILSVIDQFTCYKGKEVEKECSIPESSLVGDEHPVLLELSCLVIFPRIFNTLNVNCLISTFITLNIQGNSSLFYINLE